MLFDSPITFEDALAARKVKALLPTELSSGELARIKPELLERALFMARNTHAGSLQMAGDLIGNLLTPHTETRDGKPFTAGIDPATARLVFKQYLGEQGYIPQGEDEGTIKDFSSDKRINLVLKMGVETAQGYGAWTQGQDPDVLDAFPAQELFRAEARKVPRDWITRWQGAGGKLYEGERMLALKNDGIWVVISAFGLPYPPFDYESGMWTRDIGRDEAMDVGLIDRDTQINPQSRKFNEPLPLSSIIQSAALKFVFKSFEVEL